MKSNLCGILCAFALTAFAGPVAALTLDYSNISGSELVFDPLDGCGGGSVGCFEFTPALPANLQITSSTSGASSGLLGSISGTFGVGNITTIGPLETAAVSGTGDLTIYDGQGYSLTATLTWENIFSFAAAGGINFEGVTNLSAISYDGNNSDLSALANGDGGFGIQTLSFQFDTPLSLTDLFSGSGITPTSFSGSISVVPVPAAVWLFFSGLLGFLAVSRKMKVMS